MEPLPLPLPAIAEAWKLNRGTEFAPGADASLDADGKRLLLKVDNTDTATTQRPSTASRPRSTQSA